ncbi:hypothetical protein [Terrarubrum flagellatum]|uniref:hypothetical protein n=1 Tax=Terrirubrum flagellatum TaxID=2895980 RepID=UPI0031456FCF
MANRAAIATQADVARAIRAAVACGLTIVRIVARPDGIAVETDKAPSPISVDSQEPRDEPVDTTWDD